MTQKKKSIPDDPTHQDGGRTVDKGNYSGPLQSDAGNEESYRKAPRYYPEAGSARGGATGRYQPGWTGVGGDVHGEDNRGKGPKGYTRSDDRIREDVCETLTADRDVDATDIEVKVDGGEVTLVGTVRSKHEKRCAEDCAEAVSGVLHVQNNLRAEHSSRGQSAGTGQGRDRES